MENHVTALFLAWQEKKLPEAERAAIERHLASCPDCTRYYRAMTFALEEAQPSPLPHLEPDPFLPSRIKALATDRRPERSLVPALRYSGASLSLVVAIAIGIYLGKGLVPEPTQQTTSASDVLSSYYSALTQENFATVSWDSALVSGEEAGR